MNGACVRHILRTAVLPAVILGGLLIGLAGCASPFPASAATETGPPQYASYRDIPGITAEEESAIETLKKRYGGFTLAMLHTTEAFYRDDGTIGGFTSLLCGWLTDLFGVPFKPDIVEWETLIEGLASRGIDFTGELTATPERRKIYHMTGAIAERSIRYFRLAGNESLPELAARRTLRFAFLEGATTGGDVREVTDEPFVSTYVKNYGEAVILLRDGTVDAFFAESPAEAAFAAYDDITTAEYFPLIYSPVSFSTGNPELVPIISVVQKYLDRGGIYHLTELYNQGEDEYRKYKFSRQLTEEEQAYLREHGDGQEILFAAEYDNYPFSFYNAAERQWQGIAIDMLDEISALSGLSFTVANEPGASWPELLAALEEGKVALISELIPTNERQGHFLWPEAPYSTANYALISRAEHENIKVNQILYASVALAQDTAYEQLFDRWFPNHPNTVRFDSTDKCFAALDRGEVDFVMASRYLMLNLTHYLEKPGFKVNILFENTYSSSFGLNKNETVLCSIIGKAQKLVDTARISDQWTLRVFDYRAKLARTQLPYAIGLAATLAVVIALLLMLLRSNRRTAKAALEASRTKSDFLARMSHEIRTPMNAVIGFSDMLLQRELPGDVRKEVWNIKQAGSRLLSIINDILDFSKIEAGKMELTNAEYAFGSLMHDVENIMKFKIAGKPVTFATKIDDTLPNKLYGDVPRIRQILLNLLSNAIKYTSEGSVVFTVSGRMREDGKLLLSFEVADTGIGIREEDLGRLFGDFTRVGIVKSSGIEGTGLGLVISQNLCNLMGGEITVRSVYGEGSVFTAVIPQDVADARPFRQHETENEAALYTEDKRGAGFVAPRARILTVDDSKTNLRVLEGLLSPYNVMIDACLSGEESIALIKRKSYDLVFMDHMMPGMDGVETVAIMRKQEGGKDIPIVALTANAIAGMREMFLENGFDDFLSKPIDMHKLNRIMEKWIPLEKQEAAAEKDDADAPPNAALSELEGLNTAHGGVMADDLKNETPATADDDGDPGWRQ